MYRIDSTGSVSSLPTPATPGTPGYWTAGDPGTGQPATIISQDWLNMMQEENMSILTAASLSESKTTYNQVLTAIQSLIATAAATHGSALLTATSASTYTVPSGVYSLSYVVVGGGGGGGGGAATTSSQVAVAPGGNGASWAQGQLAVTPGQTISYHCGTGGSGGSAGGTGATGNNTVFGSITAYGGHGGLGVPAAVPPVIQGPQTPSNVATGGVVNGGEDSGLPGICGAGLNNALGGVGGQGPWGGGGGGSTNAAGQNATAPGAGGGGGSCYPSSSGEGGGNGAAGVIYLSW